MSVRYMLDVPQEIEKRIDKIGLSPEHKRQVERLFRGYRQAIWLFIAQLGEKQALADYMEETNGGK